ncbi:MAG TPA: CCA tRNA nucleotidyltransferase [Acidimicrobiales bacterium]|nr:CCA tRNA nucleotidyltransferase [Acidimicrobiales bacterium]
MSPGGIPERLQPILDDVRPLAERFTAAGHGVYLVGGVVRDLVLGRLRDGGDLDLTTDARPDRILALLDGWADATWTQGQEFGTIGARKDGVTFEVTTHRAEAYRKDSRKPHVVYADDITEDLSRRDFTVNAMALRLPEVELVDPYDGVADLAAGVLRTPLAPEVSLSDDPLRMLRAARFVAGYGLKPEAPLAAAVRRLRHRLEIVSAERVRDELSKLLVVDDPSAGLWFVVDTELSDEFLPELRALRLEQDPIHRHKDVLAHTVAVVARTSPRLVLRLAALMHDVGKPKTRSIGPRGVSFHHHDVVGARMARDRLRALRFPTDVVEDVSRLVFLHLRFHGYHGDVWTDAAVRRYARDAGPLLDDLNELTRSDCTTRNERKARTLAKRMDDLEARIAELREREELGRIRPDIDGNRVMELLGISPGPLVGEALSMLLEARLDEGPLGREEAERRLLAWWSERRPAAR